MKAPMYSGIITNYVCTAACRHCVVASSPDDPKEFITEEMADRLGALLAEAGTHSVHIGGGEPFMNFTALCSTISALARHGVYIDYIETNAFWCKDEKLIRERLAKLKSLGVDTIMISVDPFHIEYVPLERALLLREMLVECGFDYFIWKEQYLRRLLKLGDLTKAYSHEELKAALGEEYIAETAAEYGLGMNGRALNIAKEIYPPRKVEEWLDSRPCRALNDVCHCHLDLYGNVVPSGCPGIAAEARDFLTGNLDESKYPVIGRLAKGGLKSLYDYALEKGFTPAPEGYPTKCSLCYEIRKYLLEKSPSPDISPECFYSNI